MGGHGEIRFKGYSLSIVSLNKPDDSLDNDGGRRSHRHVKIIIWVDGVEGQTLEGLSATFSAKIPETANGLSKQSAVVANPSNCYSNLSSELSAIKAFAYRGDCDYLVKAEVAQAAGVVGLVVINYSEDIVEMSCSEKNALNISIHVVMIAKHDGEALNKFLSVEHKYSCCDDLKT